MTQPEPMLTHEPEVAIAKLQAGEILYFSIVEVARLMGFKAPNELLPFLRSGELRASGEPDGRGGYNNLMVRSDDVLSIMARYGLPPAEGGA